MLLSAHVAISDSTRCRDRDGRRTHQVLPHVPWHDRASLRQPGLRGATTETTSSTLRCSRHAPVDSVWTHRAHPASRVVRSTPHAACIVAGSCRRSNGFGLRPHRAHNMCSSVAGAPSSGCSSVAGTPDPAARRASRFLKCARGCGPAALAPSARRRLGRRSAPASSFAPLGAGARLSRPSAALAPLGAGHASRGSRAALPFARGARPALPAALEKPRA